MEFPRCYLRCDRAFLNQHQEFVDIPTAELPNAKNEAHVFVPSPSLSSEASETPQKLRRLISKFDPVRRDHFNRTLGKAGEAFVVEVESRRLTDKGRSDLAKKIRWTSQEDGDGAGFDVLSYDDQTSLPIHLEVKTTNGSARTPFFLTRTELSTAEMRPNSWKIYRVHHFSTDPRIFILNPPLASHLKLVPDVWKASF